MSDNNNTEVFLYMGGDMVVSDDVVRVRVHPSVTVIPESAFYNKKKLQEVELCDGLLEIGAWTFCGCFSLKHISIPSTVTVIRRRAFNNCGKLETIQLNEGLLEIGDWTFNGCTSLNAINIPSSVRTIGRCVFYSTSKLSCINLPEGIESIEETAFGSSKLLNFRMPPLITTISRGLFYNCDSLFSVELSDNTAQIKIYAFGHSLRNLALPINTEMGDNSFLCCTDLKQLFGTKEQIITALKSRFDTLPIHKMIYYHSYNNLTSDQLNEATDLRYGHRRSLRSKLNPTGRERDCLGMTPLHILACSTIQSIELYRVLIDKYPENLITEDGWGTLPILYAVWGNAPNNVVQYLVKSFQSLYPDYELNWSSMVETLGLADAPLKVIQNLLDLQRESFPEQSIDWTQVVEQLAEDESFDIIGDGASATTAEESAELAKEETFRFLVKCSISNSINTIGLKQWRDRLFDDIESTRPMSNGGRLDRHVYLTTIRSKLAEYEAEYHKLRETTTILELALWKTKMSNHSAGSQGSTSTRCKKKIRIEKADLRDQCRISCGAEIVIQHVLPYLLPGAADIR